MDVTGSSRQSSTWPRFTVKARHSCAVGNTCRERYVVNIRGRRWYATCSPGRMGISFRLACCTGVLLFASGCLSSTHSIPKNDLKRLAHEPPAERGNKVRVLQKFNSSEQPPKAHYTEDDRGEGASIHLDLHASSTGPRSHVRRPRGSSSAGGRGHSGSGRRVHGSKGTSSSGKSGKSGGGSFNLSGIDGDAAAALAVVVVASAAVIAVVAAGSEGARYDGWARLDGGHPIHLYGPQDSYKAVPLRELTVEDAEWAERAYVRKSEGPWKHIGRAPLNRQGWAYSVFLGAGELGDSMDPASLGPASHIQLGYFPIHEFGLHADIGFGWGDASDPEDTSSRFAASAGLEAQLLPFQSRRVHAGGFAQAGRSVRTRSAGGGKSALYSTGALMQLDITTRLALTARAGVTRAHDETASEMSLGLSIY